MKPVWWQNNYPGDNSQGGTQVPKDYPLPNGHAERKQWVQKYGGGQLIWRQIRGRSTSN